MGDDCSELQNEELEVLDSIYEGDDAFVKGEEKGTFQYKYGQDGDAKSFLLELRWGPKYPEEPPEVSLDAFYNRHLVDAVRTAVVEAVKEEASLYLGTAMTYTLFEMVKERAEEFLSAQPEETTVNGGGNDDAKEDKEPTEGTERLA